MKKLFIILFIAVIAIAAGIYLLFIQDKTSESSTSQTQESLVPSTPSIEPQTNPVEGEIPDLNPAQNTNPFSDAYINPFSE